MAGARLLDLDGAAVDRVAPSLDEPRLFQPIEVARHRRAFDADRAGELQLRAPRLALERIEDQPDRERAAANG